MNKREVAIMDDLDVLLQDLEATIPDSKNIKEENFDETNDGLNPNITELDSLLEDLYITEDAAAAAAKKGSSNSSLSELNGNGSGKFPAATQSSPSSGGGVDEKQLSTATTTASQQLDDLMASLHDFHVNVNNRNSNADSDKSEPPYAKPEKSRNVHQMSGSSPQQLTGAVPQTVDNPDKRAGDLDEMLKDMNKGLLKQGIRAASKGVCGACGKPVMGEVTTALGQVWHPEHFVCVVCDLEIGTSTFFEREGKPYCEEDYHRLFAPTCAYCSQPVLGQCVTALNKTWHPEHFFCAMCGNFFGDDGFHEYEGKPYCRADYYNMFAPKCGGCCKPILTNYISALNAKWHPECFVCRECMAPFTHGSFFELNGLPYCETHYHAIRGSLCAGCQKPITSRCISAMGKKFHQEHFVCAFCLKQLNKGTFKEQNDKPYCHQCFMKLFAKNVH